MSRRSGNTGGFEALRIEGGLLPAEFLNTVASLKAPQQNEADYQIPAGLRLRDEIGRYWRIAHSLWQHYAEQAAREDTDAEKAGIAQWLEPLLSQVLGYADLHTIEPRVKDERHFPVTHLTCGDHVPLVLTICDQLLDKGHARFGEEGRKRSPHGLAQEYLNAEESCLWAIVANGAHLRLLRDNPSLTRPAYLEVDLDRMFREELYPDFAAFWLICHASHLRPQEADRPESCILEIWRNQAQETGERALDRLRQGVEQALRELGSGFLEHKDNQALRQAIEAGELDEERFFQQLLRLIYRFLFLFTAEDRGVLHAPDATPEARELYREGYSLARLRERATARASYDRHFDLWDGLKVTIRALHSGAEALGLPPLGGLFDPDQCPQLDTARLPNRRLLAAVHALAWFRAGEALTRINYRDMDTEELGSVYESLLELVPVIRVEIQPWRFGFLGDAEANGEPGQETGRASARKLTGSYYTPDSLVQELIKTALEPVIGKTLEQHRERPGEALLALRVVDPAVGSGHFLLAAARRMAAELARLEAGADQPSEAGYRHALREVVAHCIYGVDLNPLAVELCKTALWLETVEPGKPLGFLDAHIRCGNALVGVLNPAIIKDGIPDEAYKALTGDDTQTASQLKRANKAAREAGVQALDFGTGVAEPDLCAVDLDHMPEDTPEQVAEKRTAWETARAGYACRHQRQFADLFTAAFFVPKRLDTVDAVPTSADLMAWREGREVRQGVTALAERMAGEHRFFHWYIEFPEVFAQGGFDCVLGNPPWERIKLQEKEFFASRAPEIGNAPNAAARRRLIEALNDPPAETPEGIRQAMRRLYQEFQQVKQAAEAASQFVRTCGRFPLTGIGDVNLYAPFSETFLNLLSDSARSGGVFPSALATDDTTKYFFSSLIENRNLVRFWEFENIGFFGAGHGHMLRFALTTFSKHPTEERTDFFFQGKDLSELKDPRRHFKLTAEEIKLINPNTGTCPIFQSEKDAELTKKIYRHVPVLIDESRGEMDNPWGIRFNAMFHMSNASSLFRTLEQLRDTNATRDDSCWKMPDGEVYVPLYEAKMVYQFNHRHGDFSDAEPGKRAHKLPSIRDEHLANPKYSIQPYYWVPRSEVDARLAAKGWEKGWLMGWRDVTDARASVRTVIASVVPRVGVGDKFLLMLPGQPPELVACLLAEQNALVHDYIARQKVGGTSLKYFTKKQLVNLPPDAYTQTDLDFIVPRVLELTFTAEDMRLWAEDLGYTGDPFPWNSKRRRQLRAELDAYYAHLYGLTRDELRYILDPAEVEGPDYPSETFRVLKDKEIREFGDYRTYNLVLDAWDRLEQGDQQ